MKRFLAPTALVAIGVLVFAVVSASAGHGKATRSAQFSGKTITVQLEEMLLDRCTALAKKKRISRDELIARGLKAFLAAEDRC